MPILLFCLAALGLAGLGLAAAPALTVTISPASFTSTIGSPSIATVELVNEGPGVVTVRAMGLSAADAPFSVEVPATPFDIAGGERRSVRLEFSPTTAGAFTARLRVETSGGEVSVGVAGTATPRIGGLIGTKGTQLGAGGLGAVGSGLGAPGVGGIMTVGGDPVILGALDKSLIDAVIKRNMAKIRYCYQKELSDDKTLAGKITVKFVVAKDGSVTSAVTKSTTMNNAGVEGCLNSKFMGFAFPAPKGGGIVIVSYPFIFSPA